MTILSDKIKEYWEQRKKRIIGTVKSKNLMASRKIGNVNK
jgi:hypothetical protein